MYIRTTISLPLQPIHVPTSSDHPPSSHLLLLRRPSLKPPLLIFFFSAVHPSNPLTILRFYCSNTTVFSTTYRSNINTLLSSLSSSAANGSAFHSSTVLSPANTSNSVSGLYLCRGDGSPSTCNDCIAAASATINASCPTDDAAIIWYAECMLRLSKNESFFDQLNDRVFSIIPAMQNVTNNVTGFNQVLNDTLKTVAAEASSLKKYYATYEAEYYDGALSNDLYALAQCTLDLSSRDCRLCLRVCIESLPFNAPDAQGAWVLGFSCVVEYANYLFYETAAVAPAPATTTTTASAPPLNNSSSPTSLISGAKKSSSTKVVIGGIAGATVVGLIIVVGVICLFKGKRKKKTMEAPTDNASVVTVSDDFDTEESLLYDFDALQVATNNFSDDCKIGQGGFGSVYKGTLPDGQEIAVKRLSTSSGQVVQDLKNEVILVAKLQHRNLLRLLGYCLAGEEKLLVYEYAPNKSLNTFLFDPKKKGQLDWPTRYKIITGVARGMLYLHEDSQLRIIHRDLKASNVLLDANMNPKISDFGIARIFSEDQTQGNTCRVVGTYGYISPEYAMHGKFSMKSDVYSFGVLVLEIVSGQRNNNFHLPGYAEDLLSYAWKLWSEGTPLEFVDPVLRNSCSNNEVIRCIHLGMLCVQDDMAKRPPMSKIVLMLCNYSVSLPTPRQPLFIRRRTSANVSTDKSTSKSVSLSVNDVTMTEIDPR